MVRTVGCGGGAGGEGGGFRNLGGTFAIELLYIGMRFIPTEIIRDSAQVTQGKSHKNRLGMHEQQRVGQNGAQDNRGAGASLKTHQK
jgi:hypothetical protein